jgi:hypothetical protein
MKIKSFNDFKLNESWVPNNVFNSEGKDWGYYDPNRCKEITYLDKVEEHWLTILFDQTKLDLSKSNEAWSVYDELKIKIKNLIKENSEIIERVIDSCEKKNLSTKRCADILSSTLK